MKRLIIEIELNGADHLTNEQSIDWLANEISERFRDDEDGSELMKITKLICNNDPMLKPVQHPSYDPFY